VKRTLKIAALVLTLGTTTLAAAATTDQVERFADRHRQMQALSSGAPTYANRTQRAASSASREALVRETFDERFARLQDESSNSSGFEASSMPTARVVKERESFASVFARLQAASSNSGEYGLRPDADEPTALANRSRTIARSVRGPV
jgi:hypothetical protein